MSLGTTVVLAGHPAQVADLLRSDLADVSILRTADAESTARTLAEQPVDLVIYAPGQEGLATRVRERRPELAVIALAPREDGRLDPRIVLAELRIATLERRCAGLERTSRSLEDLAVAGRLAAGVVHEVNNVLDGARRYLRLATKEEIPAAERKSLLDHGLRALERMGETLRAMLEFSRSAVVREPDRAVGDVVDEALRLTEDARARIAVTTALDPASGPIPGTFLQVLVNLLRNAYRACAPAGRVRITARREPGQLRLTVEDDGKGFAPTDSERIFAPFHRGDTSDRGTGLGLTLSRTLVERAGGRIEAASDGPDRGARFTIVLPDRRAP